MTGNLKFVMIFALLTCSAGLYQTGNSRTINSPNYTADSSGPGKRVISGGDENNWTTYRRDQRLSGFAPGLLRPPMDLAWSFKTGGPVRSTAAIVNDRVYIGSDDGKIYSIDLKTGNKLWDFPTGTAIEAPPCVIYDSVFIGSAGGIFYALSAVDGKLKWKFETGDKIIGGANWYSPAREGVVGILFGSYDGKLYCLDSETGKTIWAYETESYINGTPAVINDIAVIGGCDAFIHVLSAATGAMTARIEAGAYIASSVALTEDNAYIGHYGNEFLSVNIHSGQLKWTYKDKEFPFFSSAAIGAEQIVFGGRDKRIHCVDRNTGKRVWVFDTFGKVDSSPVICGNFIVSGSDDGRLYIIGLADGQKIWSYDIGRPITSSPAVINNKVVIGSEDGVVYSFSGRK
jgi:eukaryotic-like serine/threonine-protein kinase